MSDETQAVKEPKEKTQKVTLDLDQLQSIVTAAVQAATQASAGVVAAAVVEAKKPTPDPRQEAADEQMRQSTRINKEIQEEAMRLAQEACPHRQGSNQLSSFQGPLSSFVLHILDTNLAVAICTNCLKVIFSDTKDPQELKMLREKSGNQPSSAGRRYFRDPEKAMKAGR